MRSPSKAKLCVVPTIILLHLQAPAPRVATMASTALLLEGISRSLAYVQLWSPTSAGTVPETSGYLHQDRVMSLLIPIVPILAEHLQQLTPPWTAHLRR